ncbi:CRP-like cAMP-binding protein [Streptomyces sp. 1114.5]|uniref:Crp/Fnr family transcriptional regulator n=1 Tax=unclassified Streptomyces TaxID=2593676 RepID=UPI000BD25323|nr:MULTISPECIES: Crp/Fnr family transcriptional regulator [unclassified Streptomyces]RKT17034.1 CRP-like cAMP-binding protein [Streptomyces sp. 1114.5]SOB83245.1 cAMP-binding domain of CRP or a regulatory subunit of cAMP-dependent protein kinases [Streptomyces sp. 1331.2]
MIVQLPPDGLGTTLAQLIRCRALSASTIEVARRDVVYGSLDRDSSIYLVEKGQVKATVPSRDGKECLLDIYTVGDVFGELCLVADGRFETATAMTPTVLRRISAAKVLAALADAGLREEFVRYMARRLFEQQQSIMGLVTEDSEYRLAATLLHLGRKLGRREAQLLLIEEKITQEELAAMVGTTRSRVGLFLKRFRDAGLVGRARDCFLTVHEPRVQRFMADGDLAMSFSPPLAA